LLTQMNSRVNRALFKVQNGKAATRDGELIVNQVKESFNQIQLSFGEIDQYISNEFNMIEDTQSPFSQVLMETESIASVAEETTEEMMAMEEQNSNIETTTFIMKEISDASQNLEGMIPKKEVALSFCSIHSQLG
jgi:methyl-accepting chemotaxis protein